MRKITRVEQIIIDFKNAYGSPPTGKQILFAHTKMKDREDRLRDITIEVDL